MGDSAPWFLLMMSPRTICPINDVTARREPRLRTFINLSGNVCVCVCVLKKKRKVEQCFSRTLSDLDAWEWAMGGGAWAVRWGGRGGGGRMEEVHHLFVITPSAVPTVGGGGCVNLALCCVHTHIREPLCFSAHVPRLPARVYVRAQAQTQNQPRNIPPSVPPISMGLHHAARAASERTVKQAGANVRLWRRVIYYSVTHYRN